MKTRWGIAGMVVAVMLAWIVYGLCAAWRVWHGKDFSYPLIGRWIK